MHEGVEATEEGRPEGSRELATAIYQLKAGPAGAVRRVLVTLNAATDVTAGSRFEARSAEVIASLVNGLSADSEVMRIRSSLTIRRVYAAQAGSTGYLLSDTANVAESRMALWTFPASDQINQVDVMIGPSPDGGTTLPVRCVPVPASVRNPTS